MDLRDFTRKTLYKNKRENFAILYCLFIHALLLYIDLKYYNIAIILFLSYWALFSF
jgi:hypothetical protein